MRLCHFGLAMLLSLSVLGCTKATIIGTPCKADKDCNVDGQVCAPGFNNGATICTRKCTANTGTMGCPIGYDCFPTDPAKGSTCNKALYEFSPTTGAPTLVGVDCSGGNDVCLNTGSTNAMPSCRRVSDNGMPPMPVDFNPSAYCTGTCAADYDCPLEFYCGTDYDMAQKCLRRRLCTPCTADTNCSGEWPICVPTADGTARYCSKPCKDTGDCGGTSNTAFACVDTTNGAGGAVKACTHRYGSCLGEGKICDPCFTDDDCTVPKTICFVNLGTSEGFCTKGCSSDSECATSSGKVMAYCDSQHFGSATDPYGMSIGFCNGDDHSYIAPSLIAEGHNEPEGGLYSCWMPLP